MPAIRHNPRHCACRGRAADHSANIGSSVITPTEVDLGGMPKIDMTGATPVFEISGPMEKLEDEISRVKVEISHAGQKSSFTVDISFRLPNGRPMADDCRFAHAREYVKRLFEALLKSYDPGLSNLD